ncbi:MAG: exosortase B [Rhodoferax sp.]|nr:exosortase B [Rhodoferax sp.]
MLSSPAPRRTATRVASACSPHAPLRQALREWWPVIAGLALLYGPSLFDLLRGIWSTDEQRHGPIVLAMALWLLYRNWAAMERAALGQPSHAAGWPLLLLGLVCYLLGRTEQILILEIGSVIWVLAGVLLLARGTAALKAQWFALFFMLFMVPLPGAFVDTVTMPMKLSVSYVAEHVLFWAGYPIGRTGVMLQIGQYKLLVADACAGLHTLFTLEALGLLYLNLVRHESAARNVLLALVIMPISFTANVLRVMVLCLITYHFGDAAGQGFLHGFAGLVLFLSALLLIIGMDSLLRLGLAAWQARFSLPGVRHA